MDRIALSLVVAIAALTAACAGPRTLAVQPIDGAVSGRCHNDMVRGAHGLAASATTVERARVDSDSLSVRIVPRAQSLGGAAAISDPPPLSEGGDRLTIETGEHNAIIALYCG